jgi:hypothetical protein
VLQCNPVRQGFDHHSENATIDHNLKERHGNLSLQSECQPSTKLSH